MKETRPYKTLKIFTFIVTTVIALVSTSLILLAMYYHKLFIIENEMKALVGFKLTTQIQVTCLLGLCTAFFCGYAVASKVIFFMHVFIAFSIVELFILCVFLVHGYLFSDNFFMKEANTDKRSNGSQLFSNIEAQFDIQGSDKDTLEYLRTIHTKCNSLYLIATTIILILTMFCFFITKICTRIKLECDELILPTVRTGERVGMSSGSLRKRHLNIKSIYPLRSSEL